MISFSTIDMSQPSSAGIIERLIGGCVKPWCAASTARGRPWWSLWRGRRSAGLRCERRASSLERSVTSRH